MTPGLSGYYLLRWERPGEGGLGKKFKKKSVLAVLHLRCLFDIQVADTE